MTYSIIKSVFRGPSDFKLKTQRFSQGRLVYPPPPGGGGTAICGLYRYVPLLRVWFSSRLLLDRVYKSEGLGLE